MLILRKPLVFCAATLLCLAACDETNDIQPVVNSAAASPVVSEESTVVDENYDAALNALPHDTGGTHKRQVLGSTAAKFGYYVYTPGGYTSTSQAYPLLIFLHGKSERGTGSSSTAVLDKVLNNGIPRMIKDKKWNPKYPMIVVSPQFHGTVGNPNNWGGGDPSHLKNFIKFLITKYRIDKSRIYLTGLSHGGNGVYDYISLEDDATNYIAAAAPVASYGARKGYNKANDTPIWTFVGTRDIANFNSSKNFVTKYNAQLPKPRYMAKFSTFKDAGHEVWNRTYNGSGVGTADPTYDPFNQKLFDWMFRYKRTN